MRSKYKYLKHRPVFIFLFMLILIFLVSCAESAPKEIITKIQLQDTAYNPIDSCSFTKWEDNTKYLLSTDLVAEGTCLSPKGKNIEIDCNGHFIKGNTKMKGYGISIIEGNEIIIKNCKIIDFSAVEWLVPNGAAVPPISSGLFIDKSENVTLSDLTISNCVYGIHGEPSSKIFIERVDIYNCDYGVYFWEVFDSKLSKMKIEKNKEKGMHLSGVYNNIFEEIILQDNGKVGVYLSNSQNNKFKDLEIKNSSWWGLVFDSTNSSLIDSTIESNRIGLFTVGKNSVLKDNKICGNTEKDIIVGSLSNSGGENNQCTKVDHWNDLNRKGCTLTC